MDRKKLSLDFNQIRKVPRASFRNPTIRSYPKNDVTNLVSNTTPIVSTILPSHDPLKANFFHLASPEHILFPITPIPTPVYLANSKLTESDQEAYVKGFLDAIVELQKQNSTKLWSANQPAIPSFIALTPVSPYKPLLEGTQKSPFFTDSSTFESFSSTPINLTTSDRNCKQLINNQILQQPSLMIPFMDTPQDEVKAFNIVPTASFYSPLSSPTSSFSAQQSMNCESDSETSSNNHSNTANISQMYNRQPQISSNTSLNHSTPSSSNIDTFEKVTSSEHTFINREGKEMARLARRREKNRNAARKCRTKKLERISCLEDRVKELKNENHQLVGILDKNKLEVFNLQKNLSNHINQKECKLFPDGKTLV